MIEDLGNEIIIENEELKVHLVPHGASLYKVFSKDKNGKKENILLSLPSADDYKTLKSGSFGVTCGRHAGRLENAKFTINGTEYNLSKNSKGHNAHGGENGVSHKEWDYKIAEEYNGNDTKIIVEFTLFSPDGEEGFPGDLNLTTKYTLVGNQLIIEYNGKTNKDTLINLTNHAYFNLYGDDKKEIYNHVLKMNADRYVYTDTDIIPIDVRNVEGTELDFRNPKKLGKLDELNHDLLSKLNGYDSCLIFDKNYDNELEFYLEETGRYVKVESDYPAVIIYSNNGENGRDMDGGKGFKHNGLAIEMQYAPNAINRPDLNLDYVITTPDKDYNEKITYTFGIK